MRSRACLSCHGDLPLMGRSPISAPCFELVRHVVALLPVPPVAALTLWPDGDLTHGAGAVKLGGTDALAWEEPDFSVEADAQRH